jgi:hypothetical protein
MWVKFSNKSIFNDQMWVEAGCLKAEVCLRLIGWN